MDMDVLFHTIMTDPRTKSNIAARFQNALNLHAMPPIGVFWDIENCQVPKGKSAIALVQNIREKFFDGHREAEFMCVCDINKESKVVIQELLFAQVTVVHISATSKNAADDKLKQCMKRFVDTHGAPATLLLISDDVNFASDLSDFRHRHTIRIILLHRGHAHQSLLTCAHEHYNFYIITQDLPARSTGKFSDSRPCQLEVTGLPLHHKESYIKSKLHNLSSNCGGKVTYLNGQTAFIRFANYDTAEKAKKRMDKEIIYGNRISVNFRTRTDTQQSYSPPKNHFKDFVSSDESYPTNSPGSSRESSLSPPPPSSNYRKYSNYMYNTNTTSEKKFNFPPPPKINDKNYPSLLRQGNMHNSLPLKSIDNYKSFPTANKDKETKALAVDWNYGSFSRTTKYQDLSAFSPFKKGQDHNLKKYPPHRNIGKVSPFFMTDCDAKPKNMSNDPSTSRRNLSNSFPLYSSHGFYGWPQSITKPISVQRIGDPVSYVSQWSGTSLSAETFKSSSRTNVGSDGSGPVELQVSNLDPNFEVNEMKKNLLSVFSEHVMVLHISMSLQPDGSAKAFVKVPSFQDAQYAVSRFHRKKIGRKRIIISHASSEKNPPFHILKSEAVSLLNDIPAKSLPLIKFREVYEKRYHRPIAVSELYRMRDAVTIQGDSGSRMVNLNSDYCQTPSLPDSEDSQEFGSLERPYCERHYHVSDSQGWAEQYSIRPLPLVCISLKVLSTAIHTLLDSHQGSLPLISFCDCYAAEIGTLPIVGSLESLSSKKESTDSESDVSAAKTQKGVPLEHLITCVTGVEIAKSVLCFKKVQWLEKRIPDSQILQNCSPALAGQLNLFGREISDLLRNQPQCLIAFNRFIPIYHHHFGRQCCVADYGFTKLIDLLEAVPHIVQVLGEGQNRQVTLTHRTQVKRFVAELLRILKSRASKQITITEFPHAYEQVIEKSFEVNSYGVCEIEDMLVDVPENIIVHYPLTFGDLPVWHLISIKLIDEKTCGTGTETVIVIPKREQTAEEMERTKQFATEVIELMKHTPYCTMSFNKFIPSYHHHFGKQCRVADYGFAKLIELFEAIPNVLEVTGSGDDKVLNLVPQEQQNILVERLVSVLKDQPNEVFDLNQISAAYSRMHGHALKPADFGFPNLLELLQNMGMPLRLISAYGKTCITLADQATTNQILRNLSWLLMEKTECKIPISEASELYQSRFGEKINISVYLKSTADLFQMDDDCLKLKPLFVLARDMILLLQDHGGQAHFANFGSLFQQKYGTSICVSTYGFPNMFAMFEKLSDYFCVKGKKHKRIICLNTENLSGTLPDTRQEETAQQPCTPKKLSSILNEPIPSGVPLPNLVPYVKESFKDLMSFEIPPHKACEDLVPPKDPNCAKHLFSPEASEFLPFRSNEPLCTVLPHEVRTDSMPSTSLMCSSPLGTRPYASLNAKAPSSIPSSEYSFTIKSPTVIEGYNKFTSPTIIHLKPGPLLKKLDGHGISVKGSFQHLSTFPGSESCGDLTKFSHTTSHEVSSSQSSPTLSTKRRNRIAAQFSMPVD